MRKSKGTTRSTIQSREELEIAVRNFAATEIKRAAAKAEMEERILQVRKEYEGLFAELEDKSDPIMRDIEAWAAGHPEQFLDRKSIDLLHGTIGFRTSTPRVVIPRNMDEDELSVRLMLAGMSEYVRVRRELDRQAVLAAAASDKYQDVQDRIGEFGVHVVQSERFFIDVRQEDAVGE